jgi:aminopeptidase C
MSFVCLKELDEKQRVFVGQLANIFCDQIEVVLKEELDIQILMEMLATPRPDGQQRAMNVRFHEEEGVKYVRYNGHRQLARKMRNAIKKVILMGI